MSVFYRHRDGSRCNHQRKGRPPCPGGSWTGTAELGIDPMTRKRERKWLGKFDNQREAEAAERAAMAGGNGGEEPVATGTVGRFLESWLVATAPSQRPASRRAYKTSAGHLIERLGHIKLADIAPEHVAQAQADLLEHGRSDGKGGLSPTTVLACMKLLRKALDDAVAWRKLSWNPARAVKAPAAAASPMRVWSPQQTQAFLAAVDGDRLAGAFWLLATTGMRRGEALGLRWGDVDLDAGKVSVRQTVTRPAGRVAIGEPKSERSRRTISIDPATVARLRRHRVAQLEERLAWGGAYKDGDLVFAKENGEPVNPEMLGRILRRVATAVELPVIRVHDLRHGYATAALQARVNPRAVADRLGHARVNVTLDIYSHVLPEVEEAEALRVAGIILGAVADGIGQQSGSRETE